MEKLTMTKDQLFKAMRLTEQKSDEEKQKSSGEPKIYKLSDKVVKILTDRIKDEYHAHYMYRAAANWCHDMNYKKAAAFFDADAITELEHAQGLQKYMTDFNIVPSIPKSDSTFNFKGLIDIIYQAYTFELELMNSYNRDSHSVFQDDITTFDFLEEYRKIQRESVVEFNDLINGANLVDKTDKFQILYFEQTYF
jgi:ferritin